MNKFKNKTLGCSGLLYRGSQSQSGSPTSAVETADEEEDMHVLPILRIEGATSLLSLKNSKIPLRV